MLSDGVFILVAVFAHPEKGTRLAKFVVEDGTDETGRGHHRASLGEIILELGGIFRHLFEIDDGVSDVVARGVDLLQNVAVLGAKEGGNLTERARFVLVDDAEASTGGVFVRRQDGGREVDRVADGTRFEEIHERFRSHGSGVLFRFFGGRTQVREHDMSRVAHQIRIGEVGHVLAGELTGVVGSLDGGAVNNFTTGKVQKVDTRLALGQSSGVNQVVRNTLDVRHMDGDVVGLLEELVQVIRAGHLVARQTPRGFEGKHRVVADNLHTETESGVHNTVIETCEKKKSRTIRQSFMCSEDGRFLSQRDGRRDFAKKNVSRLCALKRLQDAKRNKNKKKARTESR